ncbi:MAG TPA: SLC13 family permease [Thermoanaerobaculia bacterium]|nr:SLC13 family permease [Thermoanaerobaculia bacterium]
MGLEAYLVIGLLIAALALFLTERVAVELVALLVLSTLLLSGMLTMEEGLSGFSNPATITIGAMFILSAGLFRSGSLNWLGTLFGRLARFNRWLTILAMMVTIAAISGFINNTAAMAIFLPLALAVARDTRTSPSRLLMPLSFAAIFGGTCTLIGTSTNLVVHSIALERGYDGFGMFEFARLGLIMTAAGMAYMMLVGIRSIPERRPAADLVESFGLGDYLTEIVLLPEAKSVGRRISESPLVTEVEVTIVEILRDGRRIPVPTGEALLKAHDVLVVRCDAGKIQKLQERHGIQLRPHMKWKEQDLEGAELVEAVIAPNSMLVGRSIREINFRNLFGATVLALRHRGRLLREDLADESLSGGDTLLMEVRRGHISQLRGRRDFVLVSELGLPQFRREKILPAVGIVAAVVAAAAIGIAPIVVTAIAGAALMLLVGCLSLEEAYRSVEWKVIFLLAGILPLGLAIEKSGLAALLSQFLVSSVGEWGGPVAIISVLYLATSLLTEMMSNNATAVLLAPIALASSEALGIHPQPLLIAVTFGASASFMTPIGYQTNTMIYGAGRYRFRDFLRVGIPLNLLFWLLATILIPRLWPL